MKKSFISSDGSRPDRAGKLPLMFAAPRLPAWMFTAVRPLLGGAIGSAGFRVQRLHAPYLVCICWSFCKLGTHCAAEALPRCFTLHSNVSARGNSAS